MILQPRELPRKFLLLVLAAFLFGALTAFWARFVLVNDDSTHYHANFALFINGERDKFDSFIFYEEIAACSGDALINPHTRVHMHDSINHVVHVHDKAATWGALFANLGYTLGSDVIVTNDGVFVDGQGGELNFRLNGELVSSVVNEVIGSEDVLLVDYGSSDSTMLDTHYNEIIQDAADYNERTDPSACTGGKPETLLQRVKRTLGIN